MLKRLWLRLNLRPFNNFKAPRGVAKNNFHSMSHCLTLVSVLLKTYHMLYMICTNLAASLSYCRDDYFSATGSLFQRFKSKRVILIITCTGSFNG